MKPLDGHRVLALGGMPCRPLAKYFESLGADVVAGSVENLEEYSFLIDDLGLDRLGRLGLERSRMEAANPALVHVSVTTFGSGGPRSLWHGGELVASAMAGTLRMCGESDRPPVKEALDACTFHADIVAAAGAMAAHYARSAHGRGQHVDISIQQVAFSRGINSVIGWQFDRRKLERVGNALNYGKATVRCVWKLADGWCFHSLMTGRFGAPANRALSEWIDETGLENPLAGVDWLAYDRSALDPATRAVWEAAIARFFETRSKAEIALEGRRRGINACVIAEPGDVIDEPHLQARQFWRSDAGIKYPSRFARIERGSQRDAIDRSEPTRGTRPGPLSGIKVLDFSWALVGSITTKTLGDLGADVIKVESRKRPCLSRIDVQVSASKRGNLNDKPWFAHMNTSKRSLALDLKHPDAADIVEPLVEWADVVVENFSPGTMAKLGLDYESLAARNPAIVMVSGSVYGQTGPLASEWGVDGTGGALSGRTFLTGWPDRGPVIPGALPYGDLVLPYVMVATVVAALQQRRETGYGAHVDAAMYEVCVQQMRDALVAVQMGNTVTRTGNADASVHYQEVLPALGDDRWVAITAVDERKLAELREFAGGGDLSEWTSRMPAEEVTKQLQDRGIMAGVVQDIEDLYEHDPEIAHRRALIDLDHPELGRFRHMQTPISLSYDATEPYRAPMLGEHTAAIVESVLGLDAARLSELEAKGVFT